MAIVLGKNMTTFLRFRSVKTAAWRDRRTALRLWHERMMWQGSGSTREELGNALWWEHKELLYEVFKLRWRKEKFLNDGKKSIVLLNAEIPGLLHSCPSTQWLNFHTVLLVTDTRSTVTLTWITCSASIQGMGLCSCSKAWTERREPGTIFQLSPPSWVSPTGRTFGYLFLNVWVILDGC